MLRNIIEKISQEFISEAVASPNLLSDMASMEKYMAESYSGRIFVELLQNADDCESKRIIVKEINGNIIFANDGRPFSREDVIAISRSGSSNKKRGEKIGYRGIGFKSTTYLTDEILIYSDDTYFTFSKKVCSEKLSMSVNKIPLIRIPIVVDDIDFQINQEINELKKSGYKTVFVFMNARIEEFLEEVKKINTGMFIFLNHIEQCVISIEQCKIYYSLKRYCKGIGQIVSFDNDKSNAWYVVKYDNVDVGLKYDIDNEKIISCDEKEQLYHSYLPTFDKMLFSFKVNADFSTDPSRKHITVDKKTEEAICNIAKNILFIIKTALLGENEVDLSNIFSILINFGSFSRCNSILKKQINDDVLNSLSLRLQNGISIPIDKYKLFPDWLDKAEINFIRTESKYIERFSLARTVYDVCPDIDSFIQLYSSKKFTNDDLIAIMQDSALISKMTMESQGKIMGHLIKNSQFEPLSSESKSKLDSIMLTTDLTDIKSIKDINKEKIMVAKEVLDELNTVISNADLKRFSDNNSIDVQSLSATTKYDVKSKFKVTEFDKEVKPHISKWRSCEQQCLEIEKYFGNVAIDVSKRNVGYDIESTSPDGKKRYIEVKSIKDDGSFSITNNEYTAAHQYGDQYYICLLIQNPQNIQAIYIKNPICNISFEKRIKQWEWYCDTYCGDSYLFES